VKGVELMTGRRGTRRPDRKKTKDTDRDSWKVVIYFPMAISWKFSTFSHHIVNLWPDKDEEST